MWGLVGVLVVYPLFWRLGVDLEVFYSDIKNLIAALIYSDPLNTH